MVEQDELRRTLVALRRNLEELRDSGVEDVCLSLLPPLEVVTSPSADEVGCLEGMSEVIAEIKGCQRCSLAKTRTNVVPGVGDEKARLVFVGEAPGKDEDLQSEPFVGEAGQLLTKIIDAMGLSRSEVYLCNVLKCHPPGNRNPLPPEIDQCMPYLIRQLESIKPHVIVALGTFAAQTLMGNKEPISKLRGKFHDYHGIPLMPTFHPAFLLRNPAMKREVWDDMKRVMKLLGLEVPARNQSDK